MVIGAGDWLTWLCGSGSLREVLLDRGDARELVLEYLYISHKEGCWYQRDSQRRCGGGCAGCMITITELENALLLYLMALWKPNELSESPSHPFTSVFSHLDCPPGKVASL